MNLNESTDHDLPWFTMKSNSSVMNNFAADKFDFSMLTSLDCIDSPSVSPLNFSVEPLYQPIPLRFSKQQHQNSYEFYPIPHNETPCTVYHDNAKSSFQEIQPTSTNYKPVPKPIEISSQPIPMFVNSMVSPSDWIKFNSHSMRQGPSGSDYQRYDQGRHYQSDTLHDAVRMSFRNQYLPTASKFDTKNQSSDEEEEKKPLKTLSAYNFFFRHERERILAGDKSDESEDEYYSFSTKQSLLHDHWHRDRSQKRSHRKSHGKISFATLSRVVAQRWKELPENRKTFYRDLAAEDLKRYRLEVLQRESGGYVPHISSFQSHPALQTKDIIFEASSFFDFHPVN
jgi:hypothetical protein